MSKHYSKKRRLKYVLLALACTASFSMTGIVAACTPSNDEDDEKKTSVEDTQLLKNGNFEFFDVPEKDKDFANAPIYLINTPNNWTQGGTSSYTMSGIIGTSETAWKKITSTTLADELDVNNARVSTDSDYKDTYIDYNGMKSSDLLYKDTYAVLNPPDEEDEGESKVDPNTDFIDNPGTHYNVQVTDSGEAYYIDGDGNKQTVYVEPETGDYYLEYDEAKDEYKQPISHVLMLHNYATSHNGIAQNYASVDVELPANTAAEISVWVKTTDLKYHQGLDVSQDRGANIYVTQKVGSSTLDDFAITSINTEKILDGKSGDYNGWVEYTIYVNACDFASTTVSLKLGLGDTKYTVEGYAFFDDVTVTKYANLDSENCSYGDFENEIKNTVYTDETGSDRKAYCSLLSDPSEKIFKADSYTRNNTLLTDRFSDCFRYLIDLASEEAYNDVNFTTATAGLTVDSDNYVTSSGIDGIKTLGFGSVEVPGNVKLPKDFPSLDTSRDLLAYVKAGYTFKESETSYYERLNNSLESAKDLPKLNETGTNNMLVMLSAYGAAYTSTFELEIEKEGYQIISFWVKTSDMDGSTAATIKLTEKGNKSNSTSITLDSTNVLTTDIDEDNKDIYNGWVQCFFFVNNEDTTEATKTLTVEFCFGNTTIKDTTVNAYKAGWVALANMQTLDVEKEVFDYTGSGDHTGSLTITESEEKKTSVFDEAYGSLSHEIENGIVNPSTYSGVNGGSSYVKNNGHVSIPFDDVNSNENAGLINRDYVDNYLDSGWYQTILNSFGVNPDNLPVDDSTTKALASWYEIFGNKSVQPLIIVNNLRNSYVTEKEADETTYKNYYVKNEETGAFEPVKTDAEFDADETYYSLVKVMNYGFIGSTQTVSADGYTTVSVRVKVSKGAIAYVYLVDTGSEKNVLGFTAPSYSFYYNVDGDVLKDEIDPKASTVEQRKNILYTLRSDGLYEDADGNLRANIWNYTKLFNNEKETYYDKNGEPVSFEKLVEGETYYDKDGNIADHYLVTNDGVKVYEYKDGEYYYIVNGETQSDVVKPFETEYARYDYSDISEDFMVVIDGNDANVAGKWITVNFVISAGSESKSYRLELWSGERGSTGVDENGLVNSTASKADSCVLFDYSYFNISSDDLKDYYENEIIKEYQNLLASNGLLKDIATSEENISYYEELVESYIGNGISSADVAKIKESYNAHYYTYSLYDSANFQPFNKDVADEDTTGYDYNLSDYSETLAYLKVKDGDAYTIFTDYSAVDQSISLNTSSDDDDDTTTDDTDNSSIWLLISSIILVVALLFAMISILVKDTIKKSRRNKVVKKNNYNQEKTNRYFRKLGIKKEEIEEVDADVNEEPVDNNAEAPVEEVDDTIETSVEETDGTQTEQSAESDKPESDNE